MDNDTQSGNPIVTVVIPVLNEREFIGACIDSLLLQDIGADNIEILVVDGGSDDGTISIVEKYKTTHSNIKLLPNPDKYTVFAFNMGIRNADPSSSYITFLNCHADYSNDRLSKSLKYISEYDVEAVGGSSFAVSRKESFLGRAIALALRSWFSTGSRFRISGKNKKPQYVDTASGCLYKMDVFKNIGFFNENLIYSQDIELNRRIKFQGGKILYIPDLVTTYKSRADLRSFIKHSFRNGLWVVLPIKFSNAIPVSARHVLPAVLTLLFLMLVLIGGGGIIPLWFPVIMIISYLLIDIAVSLAIAVKEKKYLLFLTMPFVFLIFHTTYALGSLHGILKLFQVKK